LKSRKSRDIKSAGAFASELEPWFPRGVSAEFYFRNGFGVALGHDDFYFLRAEAWPQAAG
jgi:hypothetical protein